MTRREHWCAPYHRPSRLVGSDGASDTEFGCATVDLVPEDGARYPERVRALEVRHNQTGSRSRGILVPRPMTARTASCRGIPVHYEEVGSGTPVLLLHGLTLEHRVSMAVFEPILLARADAAAWRRIYPDLPGHGDTPAPDWLDSEDQMLEILLEFADAVAPGERVVIIGASWGAYLALALANRRAELVAGLLLSVPVVHADRSRRDLPPRTVLVSAPAAVADVRPGEETWLDVATVQTLETLARFRAVAARPADEAFLERLEPNYAFTFEHALTARIEAPALIVAGRQDSIAGYRDAWPLLEHLPRATFAVLDRAGHALEDEQPTLFGALVGDWLDRVAEHSARRSPNMPCG